MFVGIYIYREWDVYVYFVCRYIFMCIYIFIKFWILVMIFNGVYYLKFIIIMVINKSLLKR